MTSREMGGPSSEENTSTPLNDLANIEKNWEGIYLGKNIAEAAKAKIVWDKAQENLKYLQSVELGLPENLNVSYYKGSYWINSLKHLLTNTAVFKDDPNKMVEEILLACAELDRHTETVKQKLEKPPIQAGYLVDTQQDK